MIEISYISLTLSESLFTLDADLNFMTDVELDYSKALDILSNNNTNVSCRNVCLLETRPS